MDIYLGFTSGNRFWDKGITFVEQRLEHDIVAPRPLTTHSYLIFSLSESACTGIEAVPPYVRAWDARAEPRMQDRRYRVPCTSYQAGQVLGHAAARIGDLYDMPGLLVALAFCAIGLKGRFYQSHHATVFCSELCTDALRAGDISVLEGLPACDVTPASLEMYAHLAFERLVA